MSTSGAPLRVDDETAQVSSPLSSHLAWQRRQPTRAHVRLAVFIVFAAVGNVALLLALAILVQRPNIVDVYEPPPLRTRPLSRQTTVPTTPSPPSPAVEPPPPVPPPSIPVAKVPTTARTGTTAVAATLLNTALQPPSLLQPDLPVAAPTRQTAVAPALKPAQEPPVAAAVSDGGPRVRRKLTPNMAHYYPKRAAKRRLTGTSIVQVTVLADGTVGAVTVLSSTPPRIFDAAAKKVAKKLRYHERAAGSPAVTLKETLQWQLP